MKNTFHEARFVIDKSTSLPKYTRATEDIRNLKKGDEIEIKFEEEGAKGDYEIIDIEEKWNIDEKGDEIYWYNFTVRLVPGSLHYD
jgi:hypothetical protein